MKYFQTILLTIILTFSLNHTSIAKELLINDANINTITLAEIKDALKFGADVKAKDEQGHTLLMRSMYIPDPEIAIYLISKGADVNARTIEGASPLTFAVMMSSSLELFQTLLRYGSNIHIRNNSGQEPLTMFLSRSFLPQFVEFAKAKGFDLGIDLEIVKLFVNHGADVNSLSNRKTTPLMAAVTVHPDLNIIKYLIEQGADVNTSNENATTALMFAITENKNNSTVIKFLLDNGAKVSPDILTYINTKETDSTVIKLFNKYQS